jgi:hypothetical protein
MWEASPNLPPSAIPPSAKRTGDEAFREGLHAIGPPPHTDMLA